MSVNWSEGRTDCYVSERVGLIAMLVNWSESRTDCYVSELVRG